MVIFLHASFTVQENSNESALQYGQERTCYLDKKTVLRTVKTLKCSLTEPAPDKTAASILTVRLPSPLRNTV